RFGADYVLALDRSELVLSDVDLRFDTTHWATTRPGVVRWAGSGVEIEDIELVDGRGGRIVADGRLPEAGQGDLELSVRQLEIGDLAALLQDTIVTRGLLTLDAHVGGTLRAPVLDGALALERAARGAQPLPDVRVEMAYADGELRGDAELRDGARVLLSATGSAPLD